MIKLALDRKNLPADIGAAVTMALVAIPDAIALAILAAEKALKGLPGSEETPPGGLEPA